MRDERYTDEQYTFEDYLRDFELDYLGFDGVPDEPVPDPGPEKTAEMDPGSKEGNPGEAGQSSEVRSKSDAGPGPSGRTKMLPVGDQPRCDEL